MEATVNDYEVRNLDGHDVLHTAQTLREAERFATHRSLATGAAVTIWHDGKEVGRVEPKKD